MKNLIFIVTLLLPTLAIAGNLTKNDYPGTWVSKWVAIKGEKQKLIISPNLSSTFERKLKSEKQYVKSGKAVIFEDLLIIKYYFKDKSLRYKLVLSGWKDPKHKLLYGTLYMYEKGEQFNGIPVTFFYK